MALSAVGTTWNRRPSHAGRAMISPDTAYAVRETNIAHLEVASSR